VIGRPLGEAFPSVDLSHNDLPRGQQSPERHRGGFRARHSGLGLDPSLDFLVEALDGVIPTLIDQNSCAHLRMPSEMMRHGLSIRVFQA
jgi:hypothetical protein